VRKIASLELNLVAKLICIFYYVCEILRDFELVDGHMWTTYSPSYSRGWKLSSPCNISWLVRL